MHAIMPRPTNDMPSGEAVPAAWSPGPASSHGTPAIRAPSIRAPYRRPAAQTKWWLWPHWCPEPKTSRWTQM